ncbi:reverse transcriptase zinc-binding domain-containing protein [Artemisia annua]|uniref:Reverse transcriptase zinc-binding domain-containing protein n=1 Tax=Artemisia annua TaxID=35608 RepID=A0A2U1NH45_ARTAN|nr:reverse transcriptase zinc-binding domain-containing protein [Artemisia annua]
MNLTLLNLLSTQDRILRWDPGKSVACPLCNGCNDSVRYLFSECSFSANIWTEMKKKMMQERLNDCWDERNKRVFTNEKRSWKEVLSGIMDTIRFKLVSLRVKKTVQVSKVASTWQVILNTDKKVELSIEDWKE